MKNTAIIIPTRLGAKRFPNKPLAKISGRELVLRVLDAAKKCKYFDTIIVATEDQIINVSEWYSKISVEIKLPE